MRREARNGFGAAALLCSYWHGFGNRTARCEGKGEKSTFFRHPGLENRNIEAQEKAAGLPKVQCIRCRSSHKSVRQGIATAHKS